MSIPFTCPRCGSVSYSRHDAREGYCGRCHTWTGQPSRYAPGGPVGPPERLLTPQVLLDDPAWAYQGTQDDGRTAVWRFDLLRGPWVGSWSADLSMGAFTADWTRDGQLTLRVSAETMARAVMELVQPPESEAGRGWCWEELLALYRDQAARLPVLGFEDAINWAVDTAVASAQNHRNEETAGGPDSGERSAWSGEIRAGPPDSGGQSWVADAVQVWEGRKDAGRRERSLAELAQNVADATPQIAPNLRGIDHHTAARWTPEDAGDVIL